jgi:hypothetical protein
MAGGIAQSVGPDFKPQYHKKKKKESTFIFFRLAQVYHQYWRKTTQWMIFTKKLPDSV